MIPSITRSVSNKPLSIFSQAVKQGGSWFKVHSGAFSIQHMTAMHMDQELHHIKQVITGCRRQACMQLQLETKGAQRHISHVGCTKNSPVAGHL